MLSEPGFLLFMRAQTLGQRTGHGSPSTVNKVRHRDDERRNSDSLAVFVQSVLSVPNKTGSTVWFFGRFPSSVAEVVTSETTLDALEKFCQGTTPRFRKQADDVLS